MSVRRTPAPRTGRRGGGGDGAVGGVDGSSRAGVARAESTRRELRQLASVQGDVRAVKARLQSVEESVSKGSDAGRKVKQVHQELKQTASLFFGEQRKADQKIRKVEEELCEANVYLAELRLSSSSRGTLTIEGKNQGALADALKPLVEALVAERIRRMESTFEGLIQGLTSELQGIEQDLDRRVEQNAEGIKQYADGIKQLRQQVERSTSEAEGARSAVDDVRMDIEDLRVESEDLREQAQGELSAVQTSVAAWSASTEEHLRSMMEPAAPALSQFDDVRSQMDRLDAKIDRVTAQQAAAAEQGSAMEEKMVSTLQRQIESLQSDLKSGEQRLADIDVKCVAALDATARNRKVAKKLEAKVDGAQERLDTRLDRLAAQAMQRPPAPEEMAESVPPAALGALGAAPGGRGGSVWEEHSKVDGQLYYYNTQTRQTTFTRPAEMDTPSTVARPVPAAGVDRVLGGEAARVTELEKVVAEERNQRMLMKEELQLQNVQLKKLKRRYRKVEALVEDSLVAASDRRSRKAASRRRGAKDAKGSDEEGDTDDDASEVSISPKSLMLETAENKTKLEQLEMALQRVELTTMRLDEKRRSTEDGSDDDLDGSSAGGQELKRISARLSKVEKSVRSQATATMREMHDHETQLRGFRTQLSSIADAGGVRLVGLDEDGRAPSIDGRFDALENQLSQLVLQEKKLQDALQVLQENEALVKMTCSQLADEVAGLQGDRRTPLGALLDGDDDVARERGGGSESDGERESTDRDARRAQNGSNGGSEARLLRQTTVTVARLDSRVTALEGDVAQLTQSRPVSSGVDNSSVLASRLQRLPYGGIDATRSRAPSAGMETRARDFLMQSLDRYGVASGGGTSGEDTRLSRFRGDVEASTVSSGQLYSSKGREHLESFRSKREE